MRHGMDPAAAVKDVLKRIVKQTVDPRLLDKKGRPDFEVVLYALRKDGRHAAGSIYKGRQYAVNEGGGSKLLDCVHLFDR